MQYKVWGEIIHPFPSWSLGMDKKFHSTLYWVCDYFSLGLKLKHVSERGPVSGLKFHRIPDSKVHGANMGPIWDRQVAPTLAPWTLLSGILWVVIREAVMIIELPSQIWWRTWWRHQMETFSALLALYAGNSSVIGEFHSQRPVTRSFDVFFGLRLNKRLSNQSWGWWFETLSRSSWRHFNGNRLNSDYGWWV